MAADSKLPPKKEEFVTLKGVGIGEQKFNHTHAEAILKLQIAKPPRVWELADPNYTFVDGKLTGKSN